MTIAASWIRKVHNCEELVFIADSRLCGGRRWDECPKLTTLPGNTCVFAFSGDTDNAYTLMLQIKQATNIVEADNINPYLVDAPTVFIENRSKPLWDVPEMNYGSMPIDDGHLILEKEDVEALLTEDSENERFIRKYVGGLELLRNKDRWCLWLVGAPVTLLRKSQFIMQRIKQTAEFRRASNRPQTLALADTPALFGEIRQPNTSMLVRHRCKLEFGYAAFCRYDGFGTANRYRQSGDRCQRTHLQNVRRRTIRGIHIRGSGNR